MKVILIFLFVSVFAMIFLNSGEAKMRDDIFDVEIKLYTVQEIKEYFPTLEFKRNSIEVGSIKDRSSDNYIFSNYNYLFGWIKLKRNTIVQDKWVPSCKIELWNQHFRYAFDIIGITEDKSYFLIPVANFNFDKNFEYKIKQLR